MSIEPESTTRSAMPHPALNGPDTLRTKFSRRRREPGLQTGQGPEPRYLWPRLHVFHPPRFVFVAARFAREAMVLLQENVVPIVIRRVSQERCEQATESRKNPAPTRPFVSETERPIPATDVRTVVRIDPHREPA